MRILFLILIQFLKLFHFDRVIHRKEFLLIWAGTIVYNYLSIGILEHLNNNFFGVVLGLGSLASLWIFFAALSARLRDIGKNQLFLFLILVPFLNFILLLSLTVIPSAKEK